MLQILNRYAVVYYSRSGHTERLAKTLANALQADIYQLQVDRYRRGGLGYLRAGFDSLREVKPSLLSTPASLSGYAAVALGAPVWTSCPATPLRSFLSSTPAMPQVLGLFLTSGDPSAPQKAFDKAEADLSRKFQAKLHLSNDLEGKPQMDERINVFCARLLALTQENAAP